MTRQQFAYGAVLDEKLDRTKSSRSQTMPLPTDDDGQILPSVSSALGVDANIAALSEDVIWPMPPDWRVLDQGPYRGTCNAFAALSMYKLLRFWASKPLPDLSEEYLYAKMRGDFAPLDANGIPGYKSGATVLDQASDALSSVGACLEAELPYAWREERSDFTHPDADDFDGSAARHIPADAMFYRVFLPPSVKRSTDRLSLALHLVLSQKLPVIISLPIYPYGITSLWEIGAGWDTGIIPDPQPDASGKMPPPLGGHSVCLVGYQADPANPSHGWFLFRNSWGRRFSSDAKVTHGTRPEVPEAGYGALSTQHIDTHVWDVLFPVLDTP